MVFSRAVGCCVALCSLFIAAFAEAAPPQLPVLKNPQVVTAARATSDFVEINGKVLFSARSDAHGRELWSTNGTVAGTALLKDIRAGTGSSSPEAPPSGSMRQAASRPT